MASDAMRAERRWTMASGACMIVAATALVLWEVEVAFVAATLGIVCWFLNLRNRLKSSIVQDVEEDEASGEEDENQ